MGAEAQLQAGPSITVLTWEGECHFMAIRGWSDKVAN